MAESRERKLWNVIDRAKVVLALFVLAILVVAYFPLSKWQPEQRPCVAVRQLGLDIAANLIPVLLAFTILFLLLRGVDELREARQREELVMELTSKFAEMLAPTQGTQLRPRSELDRLPELAAGARDILIVGRSLGTVLREAEFFQDRLRSGASIRLVMVDPDPSNPAMQAIGTGRKAAVSDARTALYLLAGIREAVQDASKLELRMIRFLPTLSLVAIDPRLPTGRIVVELVPHGVSSDQRPFLLYRAGDDPTWFTCFRDVAERVWTDATPSSLSETENGKHNDGRAAT